MASEHVQGSCAMQLAGLRPTGGEGGERCGGVLRLLHAVESRAVRRLPA